MDKPCYPPHMNVSDTITVDPDILGGTPVFAGTRVPVQRLREFLDDGYTLEVFLECFPTVRREIAVQVQEQWKELFSSLGLPTDMSMRRGDTADEKALRERRLREDTIRRIAEAEASNGATLDVTLPESMLDLSALMGLTSLRCLTLRVDRQVVNLRALGGLPHLQSLMIYGISPVQDLSPLTDLPQLVGLGLSRGGSPDLSGLAGMSRLRSISIYDSRWPRHLEALRTLPKLIALSVSGGEPVPGDLAALEGIRSLRYLSLHIYNQSDDQTDDQKVAASLHELKILSISLHRRKNDLGFLSSLTKLKRLELSGCNEITDLRPLSGLFTLQSLSIFEATKLSDIRPLAGLKALRHLVVVDCPQLVDLGPLAQLPALKSVRFNKCGTTVLPDDMLRHPDVRFD